MIYEDFSSPHPNEGLHYIYVIGMDFDITVDGVLFNIDMVNPSLQADPKNIALLSTDDPTRFGEQSGVALIGFKSRTKRNQAADCLDRVRFGRRYVEVRTVTWAEVIRITGQEGDRMRVLAYRRLLSLMGPNFRYTLQFDNIKAPQPKEYILQAVGKGAKVVLVTKFRDVKLRLLVAYDDLRSKNDAYFQSSRMRIGGERYTARDLGIKYARMVALRTEPPSRPIRSFQDHDRDSDERSVGWYERCQDWDERSSSGGGYRRRRPPPPQAPPQAQDGDDNAGVEEMQAPEQGSGEKNKLPPPKTPPPQRRQQAPPSEAPPSRPPPQSNKLPPPKTPPPQRRQQPPPPPSRDDKDGANQKQVQQEEEVQVLPAKKTPPSKAPLNQQPQASQQQPPPPPPPNKDDKDGANQKQVQDEEEVQVLPAKKTPPSKAPLNHHHHQQQQQQPPPPQPPQQQPPQQQPPQQQQQPPPQPPPQQQQQQPPPPNDDRDDKDGANKKQEEEGEVQVLPMPPPRGPRPGWSMVRVFFPFICRLKIIPLSVLLCL